MKATEDRSVSSCARIGARFACVAALSLWMQFGAQGGEVDGRASLPAGITHGGQAVGALAAMINNGDGTFAAVNGTTFDPGISPADIPLRVYILRPNFKTQRGGSGKIDIVRFFELSDPDKLIPFAIAESFLPRRILTTADFDLEGMQRAPDGSYWFGDSFGPFFLHTDSGGKLLEAPIELESEGAKIRSAQNPNLEEGSAVRIMNAFRREANGHGHTKRLVVSPDDHLLKDDNPKTEVGNRTNPPAKSGVARASSEIFDIQALHRAGFDVVPYTVNDKARMLELMALKVDGIISDRPDLLRAAVEEFDANGDGKAGDLLDADGLIDAKKFSAQAHRGGRNLRPENTLPAMEVGLDNLVNTLETDCGIARDGVPVISHDPFLPSTKWRRVDGKSYGDGEEILITDWKRDELQNMFRGDRLLTDRPLQCRDPERSPVSVAFFCGDKSRIYTQPSLDDLFRFVERYVEFYRDGRGKDAPDAVKRWKNAERVRFNIETKINPRCDSDGKKLARGVVSFRDRTIAAEPFAEKIADAIVKNRMEDRADVQSFDFATLRYVHAHYPSIRTVFLFGDFARFSDPTIKDSEDGTNLQDEGGSPSPWLAGLRSPYRVTTLDTPCRVVAGIAGLALADNKQIIAILGAPLRDARDAVAMYQFDLDTRKFSARQYAYPVASHCSVADIVMTTASHGFVAENDTASRATSKSNMIYGVDVDLASGAVSKKPLGAVPRLAEAPTTTAATPEFEIGSLVRLDRDHLMVANKSRFKLSVPPRKTPGFESTEFISMRIGLPAGR